MKESEERDEVNRLADMMVRENADDESLRGLAGVNFAALNFEDELINIVPEDTDINSVVYLVSRCTSKNLPSSKQDINLSIVLNPNIAVLW